MQYNNQGTIIGSEILMPGISKHVKLPENNIGIDGINLVQIFWDNVDINVMTRQSIQPDIPLSLTTEQTFDKDAYTKEIRDSINY